MTPLFLEIQFSARDLAAAGTGRDELEDPLEAALEDSKLAQVIGGGSGSQSSMIEIEIFDEGHLAGALAIIRQTLLANRAPPNTVIRQREPDARVFPLRG